MGDENGVKKEERSDICRDFLKNICNRGNRCKFYHPSDQPASEKDNEIHFCIDFQNRGCNRENCRFVHVPRDEAERYKSSHEVNLVLARAIAAVSTGDTINGIPLCKEFQTGKCSRGPQRCRYWHVNVEEERERRRRGLPPSGTPHGPPLMMGNAGGRGGPAGGPPRGGPLPYGEFAGGPMRRPLPIDEQMGPFDAKRPRFAPEVDLRLSEMEKRIAELVKENEGLRREVQREHERYEDLYALFRQQTQAGGGPPAPRPTAAPAPYGSIGNAAPNVWGGAQWST